MARATHVVVMMGVSGAGKSTVARGLAERLGWDFAEGDELHSPENIAKMARGLPLTDADRAPWLERVARWIDAEIASRRHGVITCSALKRAYRDVLRRPGVLFVHLSVPRAELEQRVSGRPGHFMPSSLLESQLEALEPPAVDEAAISVEATGDPGHTIELIAAQIVNRPTGRVTI
ncbi:MAG TPA: gluconokinase [Solirubrobacteraceae bacterium]|nr:gluconokinase [Solirubrobacteraceae bacterium]